MRRLTLGLFFFLAFTAGAYAALHFPALSGRVVDDAHILSPQTSVDLDQQLAALENQTTDQLVVVTLLSLQGTSIEDYGYQLGRKWGIGQKDKNNGVLLIVAPTERKVRIEVGYGLEGTLTDALCSLIIEQTILPKFRSGDMQTGISDGVTEIVNTLEGKHTPKVSSDAPQPHAEQAATTSATAAIYQLKDQSDKERYKNLVIFLIGFAGFVAFICFLCMSFDEEYSRRHPIISMLAQLLAQIFLSGLLNSGSSRSGGGFSGGFSGGGGSFGGGGASGGW